MKFKAALTEMLVRLFPRRWRQQYGAEFASLLEAERFSALTIPDVLICAFRQHWNYALPRTICGGMLAVWAVVLTLWNWIAPLSPAAYDRLNLSLWWLTPAMYFATGYWTAERTGGSIRRSAFAAAAVALMSVAPEMALIVLHGLRILPVAVIDGAGVLHGHGIPLLFTRGPEVVLHRDIYYELVLLPAGVGAIAGMFGAIGAALARLVGKMRGYGPLRRTI